MSGALSAALALGLAWGAAPAGPDWQESRRQAETAFREKRWPEAEREIQNFLEAAPHAVPRGRAFLLLGDSLAKQGKWASSVPAYDKAEKSSPSDSFLYWSVRLRMAEAAMRLSDNDKTLTSLQEITRCPFPVLAAEARLEIGYVFLRQGKEADAQQLFQDFLREHPEFHSDSQVGKALGYLLMKTGASPQAHDFIGESLTDADWGDPNHLFLQAVAYQSLGKVQQANRFFQLVYKYAPDDNWKAEALYQMGEGYLRTRMLSMAEQSFGEILDRYPRSFARRKTLHRLAILELLRGRNSDAAAQAERVVAMAPKEAVQEDVLGAQGNYLVGEAALRSKEYQKAAMAFERSALVPSLAMESKLKLIWLALKRDDNNQAARLADDFLGEFPWGDLSGYALFYRGLAYQKAGNTEKAIPDYSRFMDSYAQHPLMEKVVYLLASAYLQSKNWAEIVAHITVQAQKLPPRPTEWQEGILFCIAEAYYELGRYGDALPVYKDLARRFPPSRLTPHVYQGIAFCNGKLDRFEEAYAAQEKALAFSKTQRNRDAIRYGLLSLGDLLFNKRRYRSALAYYDAFLQGYPSDEYRPEALYRSGFALMRLRRPATALKRWEQAAERYPAAPEAAQCLLEIGRHHFKAGEGREAEEALSRLLRQSPNAPEAKDALLLLAQNYFNQGMYEEAIARYEELQKHFPDDEQTAEVKKLVESSLYQMAITKGKPESFLDKFPDSSMAEDLFWDLGLKYWNQKEYAKALESMQQLLRHFPDREKTKRATYMMGEIYFKQENYREAAAAYQNYVDSQPGDAKLAARALFRKAVSEFQQGLAEDSSRSFARFLDDHPSHPLARDANYNMILAQVQAKKPDEAYESCRAFLKRFPQDKDLGAVYLQMGNALKDMGKGAEAARAYRKVPRAGPQAIEAYYNLGQLHQAQEEYNAARAAYEVLVPLKPRNNDMRISGIAILAEFYERLGKKDRALALYREVARLSKNPEWAQAARQKAQALEGQGKGE